MPKISCIIPAYNEAPRIDKVLAIAETQTDIDEIIVIDDGSSDNTEAIVKEYPRATLITHKTNEGKSKSIYDGILHASGDHLLFLDADLVGLTEQNLKDLMQPIITGQSDVSISLRGNTPWLWRFIKLDYISGERIFPKNALDESLDAIPTLPRFGLEVFLNTLIVQKKYRLQIVSWPNVQSPYKHHKHGWRHGIKGDIFMLSDIMRTVSPFKLLIQIIKMKRLARN